MSRVAKPKKRINKMIGAMKDRQAANNLGRVESRGTLAGGPAQATEQSHMELMISMQASLHQQLIHATEFANRIADRVYGGRPASKEDNQTAVMPGTLGGLQSVLDNCHQQMRQLMEQLDRLDHL